MRKILLLLILCVVTHVCVAQHSLGIRAAYGISNLRGGTGFFTRPSFRAGFYTERALGKHVWIQPELSYALKGYRRYYDINSNQPFPDVGRETTDYHYLTLPLLARFGLGKSVVFYAGPEFALLLADSYKDPMTKHAVGRFDVGLSGGAGCRIGKRLTLDFRTTQGLKKVYRRITYDGAGNVTGQTKRGRNAVLEAGVSVRLF